MILVQRAKNENAIIKEKIIKRLIHKTEVNQEEVTLHLIVDQDHYPEGNIRGLTFFCAQNLKHCI